MRKGVGKVVGGNLKQRRELASKAGVGVGCRKSLQWGKDDSREGGELEVVNRGGLGAGW
jgi:hypothetical protein